MKGAGGGLLIIVGLLALWLVLTGKLDTLGPAWAVLTGSPATAGTAANPASAGGGGSGWGGTNQDLIDAIKSLPNPPKIPASILNDPIFR